MMKKNIRLIAMGLLFAASLFLNSCASPQQASKLYMQGQTAYKQQDYHSAFTQLLHSAKMGNANAQYAVGYMYYNGLGTNRDQAAAVNWFVKASKKGQPRAQAALQKINASAQQEMFNLPAKK